MWAEIPDSRLDSERGLGICSRMPLASSAPIPGIIPAANRYTGGAAKIKSIPCGYMLPGWPDPRATGAWKSI
jgi:hypothetical protein